MKYLNPGRLAAAAVAAVSASANAATGYSITASGSTGILQSIENKVIEICNFSTSTGGIAVCLLGVLIAAFCWVFAPKSGVLQYAARAVIAVVAVFNLTAVISYFTFS